MGSEKKSSGEVPIEARQQPSHETISRSPEARPQPDEGAGLEQVREILFGAVHRDLDRRLVRADAHLVARATEIEQETRRRIDVLDRHLKSESEALHGRLETDLAENGDALRRLSREQRDANAKLEQQIVKLQESIAHTQRDFRQQLLEQAKSFLDELQGLRRELFSTLQQALGEAELDLEEEPRGAREHPSH